jgi:uncharacterized protein (DUF1499 family)
MRRFFSWLAKGLLVVVVVLAIVFSIQLARLASASRVGSAPGLVNGMLAPCPESPNCIGSQDSSDTGHYSEPIALAAGSGSEVIETVGQTVRDMGGAVEIANGNYLAARFSSRVFGFVDDFEVRIDTEERLLHFRSASRVGYGDMGVNLGRVLLFKQEFAEDVALGGR